MTDSTDTPAGAHAWLVARVTEHRAAASMLGAAKTWQASDWALVVAVCDAALRRLARHAPTCIGDKPGDSWYCEPCDQMAPAFCPEVLDDAAPWAERSDFPALLRRPA